MFLPDLQSLLSDIIDPAAPSLLTSICGEPGTTVAMHTTAAICFDNQTCLQILFFAFDYSLPSLALPNVCLTITENNALRTIVQLTHKWPKYDCLGAESMRPRTAILSATGPVADKMAAGCVQLDGRLSGRLGCVSSDTKGFIFHGGNWSYLLLA